ncbi:MAG: hypothetical protein IPL59_23010 [Candidatus Competibacteraceae bacterium]|uniref:Uncharacterized protein n=1 Tax=Candidatus Contendobacter odensis Run_B_J11 TaxID=1400861 RepID=A0A7U7GB64_9GAMM|nr:hypothetical protein [Candidatus Contendobacter odensis]MBK8537723.1 hypothetical protein [Candidatus Competibacteraceae bacterium]MBK8750687.1 hypothetical protein [Candidatus Competibacteraceae bacterium]CDH44933.1 exported hypothetical protein [Candidatus Contendobacter odensis Run_B_J11]
MTAAQRRNWLLVALMFAVPFQALAALMPSWLPHSHASSSVTVPAHDHLMHLHPDGVKVHSVVVVAPHSPDTTPADSNGTLLDESNGDWGMVYALSGVPPMLAYDPQAEPPGQVVFLLPPLTPDPPQRPPRA